MMSCLFTLVTFLLLLSTLGRAAGLGSVLSKDYKHVKVGFTWESAQRYCRDHYNDLVTISNQTHANSIYLKGYKAWIGLQRLTSDGRTRWVWTDKQSRKVQFGNQPDDSGDCAAIAYYSYQDRRVYAQRCEANLFLACQTYSNIDIIQDMKNWSQAEEYCNAQQDGLARFDNSELYKFSEQNFPIWIGLHRNGGLWKWSSGLTEDQYWNLDEPSEGNNCVAVTSKTKQLGGKNCQARLPFLCMSDNMVLVKENKSWEEALEHCRGLSSPSEPSLRFSLLSVQPGDEHAYVINKVMKADTEEVWSGLRFLGDEWLWINGADVLYADLLRCPALGQRCGALSKNDAGTVEARVCSEGKNFLCYSYTP